MAWYGTGITGNLVYVLDAETLAQVHAPWLLLVADRHRRHTRWADATATRLP